MTIVRENSYRDVWLFVVTGLVVWALLGQQAQIDNIKDVQDDTARLARQTARLAKSIQAQRANSIVTNCRETNRRHDNTLRKLDEVIAQIPPGPERVRAEQNKPSTVLLIDALVPKQDCRDQLNDALKPAPQLLPRG